MANNETPIHDLKDIEKKLKISVRPLREYVKRGDLEASKIGRSYYVTEPKLMTFVENKG